eukprot:CAMPEP_0173195268 /NCGR_PEP_ID=MMETSP1141-20130122/14956_1 /TAXON_ID=483371 /ORGANISM="non described non described, Strain CCMP2298" /LENGTH=45 /DNA_ID= /DNA_START= /DNA_END= /DNA_ORIENTATION=
MYSAAIAISSVVVAPMRASGVAAQKVSEPRMSSSAMGMMMRTMMP